LSGLTEQEKYSTSGMAATISNYKLIADDGILYIIKHDMEADLWELVQLDVLPE
jgi:hypothetical protein